MAQLLFTRDRTPYFRVRLHGSSTKIGRSEFSDVVLNDPELSRDHAVLFSIDGQFLLKKTGSASLKLNGMEVESQALKEGDKIALGPWEAIFQLNHGREIFEEETQIKSSDSGPTQAVASAQGGILVRELKLQIIEPACAPRVIPIQNELLTVGAGEKNDLVLNDSYVSTRHLKLIFREGHLQAFDLGSTNGTWINGVRIKEAEVAVGDALQIGQSQLALIAEEKIEECRPLIAERFCGLLGTSSPMQELYGLLQRVGPAEATVLILGETGTGKELVARALHQLSPRAKKPFVAVNCGAISPELMESEIFGHEKGAFTGAERRHEGAFGQAKGGTLFLDEIGELPLTLQPKLLRVLENRSFRRVGGSEEQTADVRVVAATHQNLVEAVHEKRFREDLFFRLFVLPLYLPPLRDRKEDLSLLVRCFLEEFSPGFGIKSLSEEALQKIFQATFPGNVRELRNVLLRAVLLAKGASIEAADIVFPQELGTRPSAPSLPSLEKLEEMERKLVLRALTAHQWNKARAAEALGIAKSTLFAKIKLYQLQDPEEEN